MLFCTKDKSVLIDYSKVTHIVKLDYGFSNYGFSIFFVDGKAVHLSVEDGADFIASWVKYKAEENCK